jgi:hypothetical protein
MSLNPFISIPSRAPVRDECANRTLHIAGLGAALCSLS